MTSAILHIKDSYYFEIPRGLWKSERATREDFPEHYIRLDPQYQDWEAARQYDGLAKLAGLEGLPAKDALVAQYQAWRAEHANFAKPFDRFLEEARSQTWFQKQVFVAPRPKHRNETEQAFDARVTAWEAQKAKAEQLQPQWADMKAKAEDLAAFAKEPPWPAERIAEYNRELDGKILIPQPLGKLQNNYQAESGFCISKFMILETLVAIGLLVVFSLLARRAKYGRPVRGRIWNLFEAFLMFVRDDIAKPAIGGHDADRFVPLLWTIFMFVLSCNLLGMLPWAGAPTASFSVTLALAMVTFGTGIIFGSKKFGVLGYWKNQVPHMDLPWYMAIIIKPMIFLLEVLGLFIKHAVLGFRLLANMVAGHMVLLAIMGLAVAAAATVKFPYIAAASVIGSAILSVLELFVAFLQAYVFTFLSALFIGAAVHHH